MIIILLTTVHDILLEKGIVDVWNLKSPNENINNAPRILPYFPSPYLTSNTYTLSQDQIATHTLIRIHFMCFVRDINSLTSRAT